MGYCIEVTDAKFAIRADKKQAAFRAALTLVGKETIRDSGGPHFSWVDYNWDKKVKTLEDVFDAWRWEAKTNTAGDIVDLFFNGEKYGDDDKLFAVISPYVEAGSYICFSGEDGAHWRYVFDDNGTFAEQTGRVVYE